MKVSCSRGFDLVSSCQSKLMSECWRGSQYGKLVVAEMTMNSMEFQCGKPADAVTVVVVEEKLLLLWLEF